MSPSAPTVPACLLTLAPRHSAQPRPSAPPQPARTPPSGAPPTACCCPSRAPATGSWRSADRGTILLSDDQGATWRPWPKRHRRAADQRRLHQPDRGLGRRPGRDHPAHRRCRRALDRPVSETDADQALFSVSSLAPGHLFASGAYYADAGNAGRRPLDRVQAAQPGRGLPPQLRHRRMATTSVSPARAATPSSALPARLDTDAGAL